MSEHQSSVKRLPSQTGYGKNNSIDLSNAPVAQLDRALDFESKGRGFESLRAHHLNTMTYSRKST
jgi:hypothetical protein